METTLLTFVLGGARSGKSRHAEALVTAAPGPWTYIATGQAFDDEMRARIAQHRAERMPGWTTVEAPVDLPGALDRAGGAPVLVDCLTLWLTNLMLGDHGVPAAVDALGSVLARRTAPTKSAWASCRTMRWPGPSGTRRGGCTSASRCGQTGWCWWWPGCR